MLTTYYNMFVTTCSQFVNNEQDFITKYRNKFDLTLSHFFTLCPLGINHQLQVPKFVWLASGTYITEFAATKIGMPTLGSFIPHYSAPYSDKMLFTERIFNLFRLSFNELLTTRLLSFGETEESVFRKITNEEFPDLFSVMRETQALLINGECFLDFPRPLLPNVFYMGDVEQKQTKKLNEVS